MRYHKCGFSVRKLTTADHCSDTRLSQYWGPAPSNDSGCSRRQCLICGYIGLPYDVKRHIHNVHYCRHWINAGHKVAGDQSQPPLSTQSRVAKKSAVTTQSAMATKKVRIVDVKNVVLKMAECNGESQLPRITQSTVVAKKSEVATQSIVTTPSELTTHSSVSTKKVRIVDVKDVIQKVNESNGQSSGEQSSMTCMNKTDRSLDFICNLNDCNKSFVTKKSLREHQLDHLCGFRLINLEVDNPCSEDNLNKWWNKLDNKKYSCLWPNCQSSATFTNIRRHVHNSHVCPYRKGRDKAANAKSELTLMNTESIGQSNVKIVNKSMDNKKNFGQKSQNKGKIVSFKDNYYESKVIDIKQLQKKLKAKQKLNNEFNSFNKSKIPLMTTLKRKKEMRSRFDFTFPPELMTKIMANEKAKKIYEEIKDRDDDPLFDALTQQHLNESMKRKSQIADNFMEPINSRKMAKKISFGPTISAPNYNMRKIFTLNNHSVSDDM
ncbi:uncharacterized protein LOC128952111 [Oppia nitens]|uniref:uncharacterized protein LOC128952111 n=1 Tax=Oppia nitens TaxID=1686743 RepID=UPI0023DBC3F4|nr:uncharacterized protein LOC128952111 [Oppia nitens]